MITTTHDCKICGKGIYQDARGAWRSRLGNLGTGHDHAPRSLGDLMTAIARSSEAEYVAANTTEVN